MKKLALTFLFVFIGTVALAQTSFKEGVHYDVVSEKKSDRPMVKEFFSLYCGHCFQFEPFIDSLQKTLPTEVSFSRSHVDYIPRDNKPVSFGIVKAYNMMLDLDMEKELRQAFFAAIHLGEEPIDTEEEIKQIFLAHDVEAAKFDKLYNSQSVIDRAQAMADLWVKREISSVPTLVVNEKYKINMGSLKSMAELIEITDFLLKQQ
ncbi:thiol:disulfide interchange protein DsbA/DsbL [Roseivirga sp.]|uniref:thiol:disulfide interchange protein DsbA/DsbL n=1 Tax=Roseivirga sp. TaxID=1964215 RepID=UPI003B51E8BC